MSMVFLGITHCKKCWAKLDGAIGLCESCRKVEEQEKKLDNKYKLIDILNKIANGELKEGIKVKLLNGDEYILSECRGLVDEEGKDIFETYNLKVLNTAVELIEPDHFPDVGKMAEPTDNTTEKIYELKDWYELPDGLTSDEKRQIIWKKLNEVIRYINK